MEQVDFAIHKDCLLISPPGKSLKKKSWQQKQGKLFGSSRFGTKRLEIWDEDTKSKTPVAVIQLDNCVKITSDDDTHFTLMLSTAPFNHEFGVLTPACKNKWLAALQSVTFGPTSESNEVEEDNELYCSSDDDVFFVSIAPSVASTRCNIDHNTNYILQLTANAIQLKMCDGTPLYTWPYCFVRRYGYKHGKFTFEAGRNCDSGEGTFFFEHSSQQEIFRCLSTKIKRMKQHKMVPVKPPRKSLPGQQRDGAAAVKVTAAVKIPSYDSVEYKLDAWRTHGVDDVTHTERLDQSEEDYVSWGDVARTAHAPTAPTPTTTAPKVVKQRPIDKDNYNKLEFFGSSSKLNVSSDYKTIAFNEYATVDFVEEKNNADDKPDINYHFHNNQPYAIVNKVKKC